VSPGSSNPTNLPMTSYNGK